MAEPFQAEIKMFGANFAPRGWALCDGQLLQISQYSALFSLLGTIYGGDGRTTFALPDMRGRVPVHAGTGPGLTPRRLGTKTGAEYTILNTTQLPSHTHTPRVLNLRATSADGISDEPTGRLPAKAAGGETIYNTAGGGNAVVNMQSAAIQLELNNTGGNQPVYLMQPFTCVNFIIAMQGTYPSRS